MASPGDLLQPGEQSPRPWPGHTVRHRPPTRTDAPTCSPVRRPGRQLTCLHLACASCCWPTHPRAPFFQGPRASLARRAGLLIWSWPSAAHPFLRVLGPWGTFLPGPVARVCPGGQSHRGPAVCTGGDERRQAAAPGGFWAPEGPAPVRLPSPSQPEPGPAAVSGPRGVTSSSSWLEVQPIWSAPSPPTKWDLSAAASPSPGLCLSSPLVPPSQVRGESKKLCEPRPHAGLERETHRYPAQECPWVTKQG